MLATKSHRAGYRRTIMPETKTKILVCNAGSSSFKFSLFDAEDEVLLADGGIDWLPHNPDARLAVDVYVHCIVKTIGAMVATLGGIDALVFTAGVGERSVEIRKRVCEKLKYLGPELDPAVNENSKPDADIATPASKARILVIATREDLTMMRETRRLLASSMTPHFRVKCARPV